MKIESFAIPQSFRPPRLPADIYYSRLVMFGDQFLHLREHRLARKECYERYLKERGGQPGIGLGSEGQALEMRARLGVTMCDFFIALEADPELRKMATVKAVLEMLSCCRDIGQETGAVPEMYWLTYNSTITIMTLCTPLLAHGYASLAVEYLIFAVLCMESQVPLNRAVYLGWRVRLYCAVCLAYEESKMREEALMFAQRGLDQIIRLQKIEAIDPVPPPADVKRILALNELEMRIRVGKYSKGVSGEEQLETFNNGAMGSLPLVISSALKSLQDVNRRTLRHTSAGEDEEGKPELIDVLFLQIKAQLDMIASFIEARNAPPKHPKHPPAESDEHAKEGETAPKATYAEYTQACQSLSLADHLMLAKYSYNYERWDAFKELLRVLLLRVNPEDSPPEQLALQVGFVRCCS